MKKVYYDIADNFVKDLEKNLNKSIEKNEKENKIKIENEIIKYEEKDIGVRSFSVPYFVENQTIINYDGNNKELINKIEDICTAYTDKEIEAIEETMPILKKYSEERKKKKLDKSNKDYNALFLSSRGKRISKRSVQNIIKSELVELVEAEGKESKKYHTHTLRHTGATLLYNEANANIFVLKIILGHESLDATQVYTHVSDKKLKELMQNFNILDRKE